MVACTICGKENPTGAEYCEDCGAALTAVVPTATGTAPVQAQDTAPSSGSAVPVTPPDDPAITSPDAPAAATGSGSAPAPAHEGDTIPPSTLEGTATSVPTQVVNPRLAPKRYGAIGAEEIPLQGDRLVVGRFDPETGPVDIDLSGTPEAVQLSRHHAELYREADGGWYVKDLGSTNGVFLKRPGSSTFGPRLTTPTAMQPGDEVAFGNARFVFKAD